MTNARYLKVHTKRPGHLVYRCRHCGATERIHVADASFVSNESLINSHECDDSTIGILELSGIALDKEPS